MPATAPGARRLSLPLNWVGVAPFLLFAVLFLIWPTLHIVIGAFQTPEGSFTLVNIKGLAVPTELDDKRQRRGSSHASSGAAP